MRAHARAVACAFAAIIFAVLVPRQMFRVAAAYAVVAWLLLQVINNLTPALRLPEWAATFVAVLLIVGFPIALLFCWNPASISVTWQGAK